MVSRAGNICGVGRRLVINRALIKDDALFVDNEDLGCGARAIGFAYCALCIDKIMRGSAFAFGRSCPCLLAVHIASFTCAGAVDC